MEFTAHIRNDNDEKVIQTVLAHSEGSAAMAEKYAEKLYATNIAKLSLIIHDFGKLCKDFDDYINERNDLQRGMIDHCYAGARYLTELANKTNNKKIIETARFIARIVISHHGLHDWIEENGQNYFQNRIQKNERYEEIKRNIKCVVSDEELLQLLRRAQEEYASIRSRIRSMCTGTEQKKIFAFYMGLFERMMLSILVDADRTDTAGFQLNEKIELKYDREVWELTHKRIEKQAAEFAQKTDKISKQRSSISDRCWQFTDHEVGICRLIVPTGGGKTLSSLRFALKYCKEYKKDHIFYVAPYQSILEQNSDVWRKIIGDQYFLEHHSDILAELDDKDEIAEYELRSEKWDVPVIATTLVQFLNTLFLGRMDSVRRMHQLCNSVIIIDEVQSMPTKCVSLFNLAMNFMKEIGKSCIVLCSATQPTFEKIKYPLKMDANASMTGDYTEDFLAFKRNEIVSQVTKSGYSYSQAADFCVEKFEEERMILFVVNTKPAAYSIYQEIKKKNLEDTKVIHLSTYMCPEHRRTRIRELTDALKRKEKVICVTTQLIEAGVDISFPCVIRSLAGLASVVQAAGRCNRSNDYERCCKVYLLNLNEESLRNLDEIKMGQNVTRYILGNANYMDLQGVETLSAYFEKYYEEMKEELNYNVEDIEVQTDLLEILSLNRNRYPAWMKEDDLSFYNRQAFKTAGKLFHVIDDNSMSVIVPYDENARNVIASLRSIDHSHEWEKKLREVQKYVVGINKIMEKMLKEIEGIEFLPSGVYALKEGYYDNECGVRIEGKEMELLMY